MVFGPAIEMDSLIVVESWNSGVTEAEGLGVTARGKVGTFSIMGRRARVTSEICDASVVFIDGS